MDIRERQRPWLKRVLATTGLSATALATRVGVAQTTLTRFLNDPEYPHALNGHTVQKIEEFSGCRLADTPPGLSEGEGAPYRTEAEGDPLAVAVREIVGARNGVDPWRLKGRGLEAAGYLPGDIMIVDLNASARDGDVVVAQVFKRDRVNPDTVFRIYDRHQLCSRTLDASIPPLVPVDGENVQVRGVVIASLRGRQARAA